MTTITNRIPLFQSRRAIRSLRDSGYSLPAALGEVIDNSLEADANNIQLLLSEATNHRGKRYVHQIAVADDGRGMTDDILHHYLQIGFSTRYMSTTTIGKYGVGAKLAACNWAQRVDVWSRTTTEGPWRHVALDLEDSSEETSNTDLGIDPPDNAAVPADLRQLLPLGPGTLVVWSKIDRLEEGRQDFNELRNEIERELGRMFRKFVHGGRVITVDGRTLLSHDPLFLMEGTWADQVLGETERRQKSKERPGRIRGGPEMRHFPAEVIMREPFKVGRGQATLTVTLYPLEVTRRRGMGGDDLAKKLRVPDNEGCISFLRLDREINYTNVPRIFPRGVQEPDRFVGVEVAFSPELDSYFGVRNVKRGVEPNDDMRVTIRLLLQKAVAEARAKLDERWGQVEAKARTHEGEHQRIEEAVAVADRVLPKPRAKGPESEAEKVQILDDLTADLKLEEAEKEAYLKRIAGLPFVVESVDYPGQGFLDIQHLDGQVIIRINTRHQFYREMWEPIRSIADRDPNTVTGEEAVKVARRTIEAITLMVIAYGKAESLNENPREAYGELRGYWGMFLGSLLSRVKDVV